MFLLRNPSYYPPHLLTGEFNCTGRAGPLGLSKWRSWGSLRVDCLTKINRTCYPALCLGVKVDTRWLTSVCSWWEPSHVSEECLRWYNLLYGGMSGKVHFKGWRITALTLGERLPPPDSLMKTTHADRVCRDTAPRCMGLQKTDIREVYWRLV